MFRHKNLQLEMIEEATLEGQPLHTYTKEQLIVVIKGLLRDLKQLKEKK